MKLEACLLTGAPDLLLRENAIFIGATERVASRLIAGRRPEAGVHARRRSARKNAQKKGDTPSQAPLTLMAWHLLIPHVPPTRWTTVTVTKVSPIRGPSALIVKAWKRSRQ